jgi:cytochrome P450
VTRAESAVALPRERSCPYDPPEEYRRLRADAPVSRLAWPGGRTGWLLTRYADARAVLADPRFSSRAGSLSSPLREMPPEAQELLRTTPAQLLTLDPPEHTRYRRLLTGHFTVRRMRTLEEHVAEIVDRHLDALGAMAPPVDLVQAFALPVPSLVICELLGVPYADRHDFQRRAAALLSLATPIPDVLAVRAELRRYMRELVADKRRHPAEDLLSDLTRVPVDSGGLSDEEVVSLGILLLLAGHETTANMLALGTLALLEHPDQLGALRADPALLDPAVEELLRYLTIVQFGLVRVPTEDVEIGGHRIRAGEPVLVSLAAANRDPAEFTDPERLDVTREYSRHLAFGHGVHQCLGQQLARIEMRAGFGGLLRRFPGLRLAVPAEQVPMKSGSIVYGVRELSVTW